MELAQLQKYEKSFSDGDPMKEYVESRISGLETSVVKSQNSADSVQKRISESEREVESEAIQVWIQSTEAMLSQINTTSELSQFTDKLQSYANRMGSDENLQGQLLELDSKIRLRRDDIEKETAKDDSICVELERHLSILASITGYDNPGEYQVAQSYHQELNVAALTSEKAQQLAAKLEQELADKLLPANTQARVESVETDLDRAELDLANTEVHVVALDGVTLVEARDTIIRIYEVLVEVKNNLEDLIKIKRELARNSLLESDNQFSAKLMALRERFNQTGDNITQNKATLSKSIRRIQKVKKAVDETHDWALEVLDKMDDYKPQDRQRLREDAATRLEEMKEATNDCVNKIRIQLSADTTQLEADVSKGLESCSQIVTRLSDDTGSSSETTVSNSHEVFILQQ